MVQGTVEKFRAAMLASNEFGLRMRGPFTAFFRIPPMPRLLGPRLEGLNILALGTCQIEGLLHVAGPGFNIRHMLMQTGRNAAIPEVDLTGMDAVVVGLTLRALIHDTCMARLKNAREAGEIIERCAAVMEETLPRSTLCCVEYRPSLSPFTSRVSIIPAT